MGSCCVVQFAKSPVLGSVKTRMQPYLSPEESLQLHCRLLEQTCSNLSPSKDWDFQLWFSQQPDAELFSASEASVYVLSSQVLEAAKNGQLQQGGDLGVRMANCFEEMLNRYDQVILVGSDCPYLTSHHIHRVKAALQEGHDATLVPAVDGGYVLIALQRYTPELFQRISWGTDKVLNQTVAALEKLQWGYQLLEALPDVDYPEDLSDLLGLSEAQAILGQAFYDNLSRRRA